MSKFIMLNNVEHQDLTVDPKFAAEYGDGVASVPTFVTEFIHVQKEYPILFRKDSETNEYQPIVLFGLQKDENLFLDPASPSGWKARYVPAVVARGPFIIGFKDEFVDGEEHKTPMIFVDSESPRLNQENGARVFMEMGGNSPYLDHISQVLQVIHNGVEANKKMFAVFEQCKLIDPVSIDIQLKNDDKHQVTGFYTVSEEKLSGLSEEKIGFLNESGYLFSAFMVAASLSNMQHLIDIKNARL